MWHWCDWQATHSSLCYWGTWALLGISLWGQIVSDIVQFKVFCFCFFILAPYSLWSDGLLCKECCCQLRAGLEQPALATVEWSETSDNRNSSLIRTLNTSFSRCEYGHWSWEMCLMCWWRVTIVTLAENADSSNAFISTFSHWRMVGMETSSCSI